MTEPKPTTTTTASTTNWLLNWGGPGWFNDVFDIELKLDTPRKAQSNGFLFEMSVPLYRSDEMVTGQVVLTAPQSWTVGHYGVTVELESSIQFYESLNSVPIVTDDPAKVISEVSSMGSVKDTTVYRFELDLGKILSKEGRVADSYDGQKFDVRHSLLVTVRRPWYTFNVTKVQAIAIQTVAPAPPTDENVSLIPVQLGVVSREPKIVVDDCGGVCTLLYPRACWNIGETMLATMEFAELQTPITCVKLILYKIEVADGDTEEKAVKELDVVVPPPSDGQPAPTSDGKVVRTEPIRGPETLHVAFVLAGENGVVLSPTYVELNEAENPLNVHYYLRLLLETGDGKKSWATNEVIIFRSHLTGVNEESV